MPSPQPSPEAIQDASLCRRALALCVGLVIVFSLLGWRLVNLHLFQSETFVLAARVLPTRAVKIPALRGEVLDATGEMLAADRRYFTVVVDRNLLRDPNLAIRAVSEAEGRPVSDIQRYYGEQRKIVDAGVARAISLVAPKIGMSPTALAAEIGSGDRGEVVVARDIGDEEAQALKDLVEARSIPGVLVRETFRRFHPFPDRAVHVLGFTDAENNGVEGVECAMDAVLRGRDGEYWLERQPRGGEIRLTSPPPRPAIPGHSIRLTLNLGVQNIVEEEIDRSAADSEAAPEPEGIFLPRIKPDRVTVIVIDPSTGSILALANRPHHSLDVRTGLTSNAAVAETYEPGSIFKLNAYAGALDRRLVALTTRLNLCGGYYQQGGVVVRDEHGAGDSSVLDAFAHSSNVGAFRMAQQLGPARFHGVIKAFGFGDRTGIELTNEASGRVRRHTDWEITSLPHIAYGYEVSVTPIQLVAAYDAILNDGVLRRPRLIDAVLDANGEVVDQRPPVEVRRVCSREAARAMRTAMLETVRKGTARKAALAGFEVGGKTGTAQQYDPRLRGYASNACNLSFFGFVQSEQRIELGILVVVQDPQVPREQEFAGTICGPIFRRIATRVLTHRGVHPDGKQLENVELTAGR